MVPLMDTEVHVAGRPAVVNSYLEDPTPPIRRYTATVALDPSKPFTLLNLLAAGAAFAEAGVPVDANIQVQYGSAVLAFWHREESVPAFEDR
jgi:hypothetical protein